MSLESIVIKRVLGQVRNLTEWWGAMSIGFGVGEDTSTFIS